MYEPFHKLKFYNAATYVDQVPPAPVLRQQKGKKALCAMYQDTTSARKCSTAFRSRRTSSRSKIVETTTHKPTDQDSPPRSRGSRRRAATSSCWAPSCATSIVPYATARKIGWTDVDFPRLRGQLRPLRGRRAGRGHGGPLRDGPDRHAVPRHAQPGGFRRGSIATRNATRTTRTSAPSTSRRRPTSLALGLEKAGADLTLNALVKGLESIRGYKDIFNGPEVNFGPDKHQGGELPRSSRS